MTSTNRNTSNEEGDKSEVIPLQSFGPTENADRATGGILTCAGDSKENGMNAENVSVRSDGVRCWIWI